jgi:hypothetical protein
MSYFLNGVEFVWMDPCSEKSTAGSNPIANRESSARALIRALFSDLHTTLAKRLVIGEASALIYVQQKSVLDFCIS